MTHTPGPWITAGPHGTGIAPASMPNERLAVAMAMDCELTEEDMYGDDVPLESQVANARLIAAAPDLLAALVRMDEEFGTQNHTNSADDAVRLAQAAINKATGGE
jgi:hypothetical protein